MKWTNKSKNDTFYVPNFVNFRLKIFKLVMIYLSLLAQVQEQEKFKLYDTFVIFIYKMCNYKYFEINNLKSNIKFG